MARPTSVTLGVSFDFTKANQQLTQSVQNAQNTFNRVSFANPLGTISKDARNFEQSLQAASQRVIAFTASLGTLGATASILRAIVKDTIAVEQAFTDINSVFQLSSKNLQQFSKDLFDVARATSSSFEVATEAAKEFSRQGLDSAETLKHVRDALILTRTSGLDISKSVETLTATINGFNNAAVDSSRIINKLVAVDQNFAVSSRDLAEALSRVGSTAQDAGVSFDELIGLITAAQQTTARGGAVIGNALKSIFTRIERPQALEQLQDLNIQVTDLQGNALPAIKVLQNLAGSFDTLSDAAKSQATQLVGGVFQINILRSILKDLGKEQGIAAQATRTSGGAYDEAIKRNEALNQSLQSLVTQTQLTGKQINAVIGQVTFSDKFKDILGLVNNNPIVDSFKNINSGDTGLNYGKDVGANVAEGILAGIGNTLSGPALFYISKILIGVAKSTFKVFGADLIQLAGVNNQSGQQKDLTNEINQLYAVGNSHLKEQLTTATALTNQMGILKDTLGSGISSGLRGNANAIPIVPTAIQQRVILPNYNNAGFPNPTVTSGAALTQQQYQTAFTTFIQARGKLNQIPLGPPPMSGSSADNLLTQNRGIQNMPMRNALGQFAKLGTSPSTQNLLSNGGPSFDDVFIGAIRREISEKGRDLAAAIDLVKLNFQKLGASAEQIDASLSANKSGLVQYDNRLSSNRYTGDQNFRLNQANKTLSSGGTLAYGSPAFKAVIQQAGMDFSDSYYQRIGKTDGDVLSPLENRKLNMGVNIARSRAQQKLSSTDISGFLKSRSATDVTDYLQAKSNVAFDGSFGFFSGLLGQNEDIANKFIDQRKITGNQARILKASAMQKQLASRQQATFAGSLLLPLAAGFVPNGTSDGTAFSTGTGSGAASGALNGAGLGLAVGGGVAGGIAGGILGGAFGAIGRINKSFEELAKDIEESNSKNIALIDAANSFSRLDEAVRSTAASGGSQREIKTLIGQQRDVFASITDPDIRRKLIAAQGNPDALETVRSELNTKNGLQGAANDITSSLGKSRSNHLLNGFFDTSLNSKDFGSLASTVQVALQRGEENKKGFASSVLDTANTNPVAALKALGVNDTLGATTKDLSDAFLAAKQNMVYLGDETRHTGEKQGNFRRELDKLAQQLEFISQYNQKEGIGQNEITNLSNEGVIRLLGGSAETTQRLQGLSQLQSVQNLGQINFNATLDSAKGKLLGVASDNGFSSITPAINSVGSIGGVQGLSALVGNNSKMLLAIQEAVQQLESIDQQTRLQTNLTKLQVELGRLELVESQRNRILDNARYSPTTTQTFRDAGIASRSPLGVNPAANRANAVLDQLNILNSLGVPETDQIIALKKAAQKVSAKAALSGLGSSNDAIGNALSSALSSLDSTSQVTPAGLKSSALPGLGGGKILGSQPYGQSTFAKIIANLNSSVQGKQLSKAAAVAAQAQDSSVIQDENLRLAPITALSQSYDISKKHHLDDIFDKKFGSSLQGFLGKTSLGKQTDYDGIGGTVDFSSEDSPAILKLKKLFTDAQHSGSVDKLLSSSKDSTSSLYEIGRKANLKPEDFESLLNNMVVAIAMDLVPKSLEAAAKKVEKNTKAGSIPSLLDKNATNGNPNSYLPFLPKILNNFDPFGVSFTDYTKQQKVNVGLTLPKPITATLPVPVTAAQIKSETRTGLFSDISDARINLVGHKELGDLNSVIDDLNKIYDLKLKIINLEGGNPKDSFLEGFTHQFDILQAKMQDFSDVGAQVGQSLESNLSGAFGNFVTGAEKGKDAFRSFIVGVLNDSSKAFASKAVQQLLGSFLNSGILGTIDTSIGSGLSPAPASFAGKANGGIINRAPALLTGGEFVVPKEQASSIGYDTLYKMNSGGIGKSSIGYATGGLVHGGSGVKDDVFAMLRPGDFVMKKSAVNQYGSENLLHMVQGGRVQKRDLGGVLLGALFGGAIGGITAGKKGAIAGALGGGLLGGLSGSSGAATTFNKLPMSLKLALGAGLLGVASSAIAPSQGSTNNTLPSLNLGQTEALRKSTEADNANAQSQGSGFLMPVQTKDGFLIYERQQVAATRRFASGGTVPSMMMGGESVIPANVVNSIGASHFANGGFVGSPSMSMNGTDKGGSIGGDVNINVTVNKDGSVANPGGVDDSTHGNMLSRQIKSAVLDILANQTRQGGIMYQAYGTSRLAS